MKRLNGAYRAVDADAIRDLLLQWIASPYAPPSGAAGEPHRLRPRSRAPSSGSPTSARRRWRGSWSRRWPRPRTATTCSPTCGAAAVAARPAPRALGRADGSAAGLGHVVAPSVGGVDPDAHDAVGRRVVEALGRRAPARLRRPRTRRGGGAACATSGVPRRRRAPRRPPAGRPPPPRPRRELRAVDRVDARGQRVRVDPPRDVVAPERLGEGVALVVR